jgi:hypothetical protein
MKKNNFKGRMQIRVSNYKVVSYQEKTISLLDYIGIPPKVASKPIVNIYSRLI